MLVTLSNTLLKTSTYKDWMKSLLKSYPYTIACFFLDNNRFQFRTSLYNKHLRSASNKVHLMEKVPKCLFYSSSIDPVRTRWENNYQENIYVVKRELNDCIIVVLLSPWRSNKNLKYNH